MALREADVAVGGAKGLVRVEAFTNGVIGPELEMLGPVANGGRIVARTAPGCWGPMITPEIRGGHEVTRPVAVDGAEVGDAIAISVKEIKVESWATASGGDQPMPDRFLGDPVVAGRCPGCGTLYPPTHAEGIGPTAIRCNACGADATPVTFTNGYTIAFSNDYTVGVTVGEHAARTMAKEPVRFSALPPNSIQHPILIFAPHDLVGVVARLRPFMGQLGTTPAVTLPDSHNAGDVGSSLIGASHEYAVAPEDLDSRTDGHMDIDAVRAGAIVICPVKVPGGGVYLGDMHALQGDGEIAGHTCDVTGTVELEVEVSRGWPSTVRSCCPWPKTFRFSLDRCRLKRNERAQTWRDGGGSQTVRSQRRSRSSERGRISTPLPTTAYAAPHSFSRCRCQKSRIGRRSRVRSR
jgi:formamidase